MLEHSTHSLPHRAANRRAELRTAKAARDLRHRARRKSGRACYTIEADGELLNLLVQLGWLAEREATDKRAVERAIGRMLADAART
jgi:hypothetical protein